YDPNGRIVRYEWDLDGNGTFERDTTTTSTTTVTFDERGTHPVNVRVTDAGGNQALATVAVDVRLASTSSGPGVSINEGPAATNDRAVTLSLNWPNLTQSVLVSSDGGFAAPFLMPVAPTVPWKLTDAGNQRLPKIIYVRFRGGEAGRET